ncbi:MAG TPA: GNAT family N-acetyltransferase [Acidimicrobiales bacterium]|nr:GNAT family N-acetyltransferase [Acidimicrobiales bacterium]
MVTDEDRGATREVFALDIAEVSTERLENHLRNWLGSWPDDGGVTVTTSTYREEPGWDGRLRPFIGVSSPESTVISVASRYYEAIRDLVGKGGLAALEQGIAQVAGDEGATLRRGVFRYHQQLVAHQSRGEWFDPDNPVVPEWLRLFNARVLVAFDRDGRYAAGVGCKRHDDLAFELAITTEPSHRNLGYARELVAQASEYVYSIGGVATYMHRRDNVGSAAVAESAGFPDRGWETIMLSIPEGVSGV